MKHKSDVTCVKKNSHQSFATGSNDLTVKLWNLDSNKSLQTFDHDEAIQSLEFLNPNTLVTATKSLYLWDMESKKIFKTLDGHTENINQLEVTSNGHLISCGSVIKVWDLRNNESCCTIKNSPN